jgi:hypothetical protein
MKRLVGVASAATLSLSLAFLGVSTLSAQEEKKPAKKPPLEKKDKGEDKKDKEGEEKKTEPKSDADKAPEPTDEKQKKQFEKIRSDVERKFKKSKKEQVFVYALSEKTMERIEATESAPTPPPTQPPAGKGRMPNKSGPNKSGYDKRGTNAPGGGAGIGGGGAVIPAHLEAVIKNTVYTSKDREEAVEKVYKFLVEFPPPLPGAKKKNIKGDDEPPPPQRSLLEVVAFPATKEGEKRAEAKQEELEKRFRNTHQAQEAKKMARKKGS